MWSGCLVVGFTGCYNNWASISQSYSGARNGTLSFLKIFATESPVAYSLAGGASAVPCAGPTQMVWMLTDSRMPNDDNSRPDPLRLTPPNGTRGCPAGTPFVNTLAHYI